ncbi:tetratricopeptide repeat protein [Mucilaginibacter koreensis]
MRAHWLAIIFTGISLAASAQSKESSGAIVMVVGKPMTASDSTDAKRIFLSALRERTMGNTDLAAELFNQVLQTDPANDAAMYELALIKKRKNSLTEARELLERAVTVKPENEWYWVALTDSYEKTNDLPKIANAFRELVKINPDKPEYYMDEASALYLQKKYAEALAIYTQLEQQTGLTDEILSGRQKIYLKQGRVDEAAAQVQQVIADHPEQVRYQLLLAEIYNSNGSPNKALEVLQKAQAQHPENAFVHLGLADIYRDKKDYQNSYNQLKLAFAIADLGIDQKVKIVLGYVPKFPDQNALNSALELSQIITKAHPEDAKAFALYGDMLVQNKQYHEARQAFDKSIQLNNSVYAVHEQLVRLDLSENDYKAAIADSERALALFPNEGWINYFAGVAYQQTRQPAKAVEKLNRAASLPALGEELSGQIYSVLGDCYHELKNNAASDDAYDKALLINADNAYTLNNYAYYLSLRNERLDKAAQMSARSNVLQPENASFEDTYAWILFKQQKYADARLWMEKALQHGKTKSSTQTEHYGDILFHLGDTAGAMQNWLKARQYGAQSPTLERKINEKKYLE